VFEVEILSLPKNRLLEMFAQIFFQIEERREVDQEIHERNEIKNKVSPGIINFGPENIIDGENDKVEKTDCPDERYFLFMLRAKCEDKDKSDDTESNKARKDPYHHINES